MHGQGDGLASADRAFLSRLQRQALEYFVENQAANGLMLDRQSNHGPRRAHGLCSTSATGMGFIALALASAEPHQLLSPGSAAERIRAALEAVRDRLPHDQGAVPHFVHSATGAIHGIDCFSTIETAWLTTGALWAAAFLRNRELETLASQLYERVDWHYWTAPEEGVRSQESGVRSQESGVRSQRCLLTPDCCPLTPVLLRHGKDRAGRFLGCSWDRINGETAFMYVLAAGAAPGRALPAESWSALRPFYGAVAGHTFNNADLGLFVFQYGLDLLDLQRWRAPGTVDLAAEARVATRANACRCRELADEFTTYQRYWGLSAGDGPADPPHDDCYRCYAPSGPIDGTAHLTATLASVAHDPGATLENLYEAQHDSRLPARGRYGFSNINLDRNWVGRDMVGIDAGAAVLALDNYLHGDRVRAVFHELPCVQRGLERLGFASVSPVSEDETPEVRRAS
jgi:hypothetical protein